MSQRQPGKGHSIRESSGPGSAEAMDLLDSIYASDTQRAVTAAAATTTFTTPNGVENGATPAEGPGGLMSVPEDQQLSDAQIQAATAHQVSSRRASFSHDESSSASNMSAGSKPFDLPPAQESYLAAPAPAPAPADVDVFGPTSVIKPANRRTLSSSSRKSASDTSTAASAQQMTSSAGKPLPGLPGGDTAMNAETTSLPLGSTPHSSTDLNSAMAKLKMGPSSLPPQHIPRPIDRSSLASSASGDDYNSVAAIRGGGGASLSTAPFTQQLSLNRQDSFPTSASNNTSTTQSPFTTNDSGRTMAERDRSSIDDIRRLHAQRAARNLEATMGSSDQPRLNTQARNGSGGMSSQRPLSVIEPRSRDAVLTGTSVMGSSSRDSAFGLVRSGGSEGRRNSRGAATAAASSNAPAAERPAEVERESRIREGERERESRDRDPERDREKDRERDRERRTRRTLGDYALGKTLGAGSMGKVKLGVKMGSGEKVAIKIIPRHTSLAAAQHPRQAVNGEKPPPPPTASFLAKAAAKDHSKEVRTIREGSLQLLLHHPYVCGMREMIIHPNHYYMIFEYVNGGQMLDYIISHGRLRERAARKFARQIGSALEYCHRNSIVHRDLKIENILISKTGNIKIIDFGLSNLFSPHSHLSTFCGSLYFAAPELLNAKAYLGPEVDVWSFGIVLYVLVCGKVPFDDQSMPALHAKIKKGQVEYPAWLSGECKHILSRMLVTNPQQRAGLPEILAHPWMVKGYDGAPNAHLTTRQPLRPQTVDPEVVKGMTGFEFGTPADIEARLMEILTGDAYQAALQAWDSKTSGFSPISASPSVSGSVLDVPLGRAGTRGSMDLKAKTGSKRFSGIDFYRKKISSNSLFGTKDDVGSVNGHSTSQNGYGNLGGAWTSAGKEPLDPTRGFHPLISIYFLVSEKMEREKLYGHSFFASSNVSLAGATSGPSAAMPGLASTRQGSQNDGAGGSSSMPTAADIPQEALRVPETSYVATASRREGPIPSLPAPPSSVRTAGSLQTTAPTPVFDSREKSQPMSIMAGPPRSRAYGDEVETALREKGYSAPNPASWNPPSGTEARLGPSARASMLPTPSSAVPLINAKRSMSFNAGSRNGTQQITSAQGQQGQEQPPPPPLEKDVNIAPPTIRKKSSSPDKRRSFHGLLPLRTEAATASVGSTEETTAEGATPQTSFLSRRFSSLIGRSPSTPIDLEGREKRRLARMSTVNTGATPPISRRGSVQKSGLAEVQESLADEAVVRPAEEFNQRRESNQKGSSPPAATIGRASGHQLATLSAAPRRPHTGPASKDGASASASNGRDSTSAQLEAARSTSTAQRSATIGSRPKSQNPVPVPTMVPTFAERDRDSSAFKPVFLKGLFSVQTTTTKPRSVLHADLMRVFDRIGLQYRELKGGYECVHLPSLDFSNNVAGLSGQGNARIMGDESAAAVSSSSEYAHQNGGNLDAAAATLMRPKRKQSRLSFLGTKKDKQKKSEGASVADSASNGSLNHANASVGEDLASKGRSESRASSITAHTREDLDTGRSMTPSGLSSRVNRARTDSLGAPNFMQSPAQNPVTVANAEVSPTTSPSAQRGGTALPASEASMNAFALELAVRFEIYVVKVPLLLGVNGLQFRRISGNPWQYQQLARRVLQELKVSTVSQESMQSLTSTNFFSSLLFL